MYHVTGQLNRYVALVIALATPFAASEQAKSGAVTVKSKTITIAEGTDMAATVSPNHKTVILDLQGLLYSIPMAGGAAKQISTPYDEDSHPDWSTKGGIVAIQSYSGEHFTSGRCFPMARDESRSPPAMVMTASQASRLMAQLLLLPRTVPSKAATISGPSTSQLAR